jgi:hypothetical protein
MASLVINNSIFLASPLTCLTRKAETNKIFDKGEQDERKGNPNNLKRSAEQSGRGYKDNIEEPGYGTIFFKRRPSSTPSAQ